MRISEKELVGAVELVPSEAWQDKWTFQDRVVLDLRDARQRIRELETQLNKTSDRCRILQEALEAWAHHDAILKPDSQDYSPCEEIRRLWNARTLMEDALALPPIEV